jgi:hypothetical protein
MFLTSSCPSSGAYKLQQPPLIYCWNVVVAVSLVVVGPDQPRPTTLLPPCSIGKPEAAAAVYKLLMMGMRMPETCWAVFKWQAINLRVWCIWLVDLFEQIIIFAFCLPKHLGYGYCMYPAVVFKDSPFSPQSVFMVLYTLRLLSFKTGIIKKYLHERNDTFIL